MALRVAKFSLQKRLSIRQAADVAVSALLEPLEDRLLLSTAPLKPDHVVVIIESDRFANAIGDTTNMPYVNQLLAGSLVYSNTQGINTSSQGGEMNYLALYSGSSQGITDNGRAYSFATANLAQSLNNTPGLSFTGFSESLLSDGAQDQQVSDGVHPDLYTRNHNPMAMFTNAGTGKLNSDVNKTFNSFKALSTQTNTYANLPTVSFVIPNNLDNTNGSNEAAPYATDPTAYPGLRQSADAWLKNNIDAYVQWAKTHNSLLMIIGNEGDRQNNFAAGSETIITGDPRLFVPGTVATSINHFNTLRTIEDMYGVAPLGSSATAADLNTNALGQLAAPGSLAATSAVVTTSVNPAVFGQGVTFTATVTPTAANANVPSGSVTFKDGATTLGTGTLNASGVATLTTGALSVASHAITAVYAGDANFSGVTSAAISQAVNAAATSALVTSSANPSAGGQSVTFTATIATTAPGAGIPTGSVTFYDGATSLGSATLNASGVATLATSALSVTTHSITAVYAGSASFATSTSPALSQVVNAPATTGTTTAVSSSVSPSVFGQAVVFSATVTPSGAGTPTGLVTFKDGATTLGTGTLNASGVATFSTSALAVASHSITAAYGGYVNFTASTSPAFTHAVNQASSSAAVASSLSPSVFGQSITFTATIAAVAPGAGTPTGLVTFLDGAASLGTGTLNAAGVATLSISSLAVAGHSISVSYAGDANFTSSASAALAQTVNQAATTTSLSSSANPASLGQSITFTASVAAVLPGAGVPSGTVQFLVDGVNSGSPVTLSNGVATLAVSSLTTGGHTISAIYSGEARFRNSTAPTLSQSVGQASIVRPDHVVVLVEEDRAANALGDSVNMPYLNQLASGALVYSNSHGLNDSSQLGEMNYLALFSGSTQNVTDDGRGYSFAGPNLAQSLNNTPGLSFAGYAEYLPSDGSQVQQAGDSTRPDIYTRSYNPMAMFTNAGTGKLNSDVSKTFNSFKAFATQTNTYANLPTVSFVLPDNLDNTHGSNEAPPYATDPSAYAGLRQTADAWLKTNIDAYVQWAKTHNSLLIITGDEGDRANNFGAGVTTLVIGDPRLYVPGVDGNSVNHYNTLRTIEDMYGIAPLGNSAAASHFDINAAGQLAAPQGTLATSTSLTSNLNPAALGQAVTLTAVVTGAGTPTGTITFKDGVTPIGTATLSSTGVATLTTSTLTAASHSITAVYSGDSTFLTSTSPTLTQTINAPATPANDAFANRITITGSSVTLSGTNVNATKESGEPNHAGNAGGKSVWWTWTAPTSGTVTIDTTGSTFDTLLAVYTGTTLSTLKAVASNDDNPAGGTTTSLVKFSATAGTVYQIAIDGYNGLSGSITMHLNLAISAPAAPSSVTATNGTLTDRVSLTWAASTGATGYQVYRSTSNNSSSATLLGTTTGTLFDDLTANSGTVYYYWIKSTNSAGTSAFSSVASGKRA